MKFKTKHSMNERVRIRSGAIGTVVAINCYVDVRGLRLITYSLKWPKGGETAHDESELSPLNPQKQRVTKSRRQQIHDLVNEQRKDAADRRVRCDYAVEK